MNKPALSNDEMQSLVKSLDTIRAKRAEADIKKRMLADQIESIKAELKEMGYNSSEEVAEAYIKLTEELAQSAQTIRALEKELEEQL